MREEFKKLDKLLREHDWYHTFSDDNRAYSAGVSQARAIRALRAFLGVSGDRLYWAYHDIHFSPARGFEWTEEDSKPFSHRDKGGKQKDKAES